MMTQILTALQVTQLLKAVKLWLRGMSSRGRVKSAREDISSFTWSTYLVSTDIDNTQRLRFIQRLKVFDGGTFPKESIY